MTHTRHSPDRLVSQTAGGSHPLKGMGYRLGRLGMDVFFMDALPFFSAQSRAVGVDELRGLGGKLVHLNSEAVRAVVTAVPPAAVHLNGSTAFSAAAAWGEPVEWSRQELRNRTAAGSCQVGTARLKLFGVPLWAVRSNFLRTKKGPNSNEQLLELGTLLAGDDANGDAVADVANPRTAASIGDTWVPPRVGQSVRVWRNYGTFMARHRGKPTYATSEKDRDGLDAVTPDEDLVVVRIDGDNFFCTRQDRRTIRVHKNHLWPSAPYNR